ncbi:hypothetical protein OEIGOIKO_06990 [Streptomyces chrestomyceticus JCM 4735]|uniref:Uncharacterized protein n=1 Tax=Streptomyces chrestomyceticus JCM 4735 TaxID=1306181 RepID=A0A7U9L166_9ACTN|nr:hypothetical protein [Streptomyces chrestomyceticus]GCD39161.1 hypothetical protein OEIGOIKO_06990 [Streptomyces chrestomyceticus JCM 4735]
MIARSSGTVKRDPATGRFVKTFILGYKTDRGQPVRTLPPRGIELMGAVLSRCAGRGAAWNIQVTDRGGAGVTFDFACCQG